MAGPVHTRFCHVVCENFGLGLHNLRKLRCQHLYHTVMKRLPSALEQRLIDYLLREGVFEGVVEGRGTVHGAEQFRAHKSPETLVQCCFRARGQRLEEGLWHVSANHRCNLEYPLSTTAAVSLMIP
jgi:hypothetical protein